MEDVPEEIRRILDGRRVSDPDATQRINADVSKLLGEARGVDDPEWLRALILDYAKMREVVQFFVNENVELLSAIRVNESRQGLLPEKTILEIRDSILTSGGRVAPTLCETRIWKELRKARIP